MLVRLSSGMFDVIVSVPHAFSGQTRGLLGVFNDEQTDDLTPPSGDHIDSDASEETIFDEFGKLCKLRNPCS